MADSGPAVASASDAVSSELELKREELRLRKAELEIRQRELDATRQPPAEPDVVHDKATRTSSPAMVAIATALFGLLGTGIGAVLQGYWNTRLERQKFEAALIQNALASGDQQDIAQSLQFLVEIGLIQSLDARSIEKAAARPAQLPETFGGSPAPARRSPVSERRPAKPTKDSSASALSSFAQSTTSLAEAIPSTTNAAQSSDVPSAGPAASEPQPVETSPYEGLSRNAEAKARLVKLGLFAGPIDDHPTPQFQAAVRLFQQQRNMRDDGMLGIKTLAELRAATPDR